MASFVVAALFLSKISHLSDRKFDPTKISKAHCQFLYAICKYQKMAQVGAVCVCNGSIKSVNTSCSIKRKFTSIAELVHTPTKTFMILHAFCSNRRPERMFLIKQQCIVHVILYMEKNTKFVSSYYIRLQDNMKYTLFIQNLPNSITTTRKKLPGSSGFSKFLPQSHKTLSNLINFWLLH